MVNLAIKITQLRKMYQVVFLEGKSKYYTLDELLGTFEVIGFTDNPRLRKELQGTPILDGYAGAMWGGLDGETCVVRYEEYRKRYWMTK
jgi:hypothetical protein